MKLGLSAWSVCSRLFSKAMTLTGFLDFAKSLDVDGVELLDCFWEDAAHPARIKPELAARDLPVSAYAIGNDFLVDDAEYPAQLESVRKGIDIAVMLETPLLRVFSGNLREGITFAAGKNRIVAAFRELAPYAESCGITMVLENHGMVAGRSDQVLQILNEVGSPSLMANTDTGNFLLCCEDPREAVRVIGGQVGYVHFKDFKKSTPPGRYSAMDGTPYIGTPLGAGEVPLAAITLDLADRGYAGWLSIEYEGDGVPEADISASVQYARSIMPE